MGKHAEEQQEGPLTAVVLERGEDPVVALRDGVLGELVGDDEANGAPTGDGKGHNGVV